ncbi:MAG: PadR family transcriptional regulator [Candidatus Bathyarchaeota archaeon]|nr:PadR family transcriptional regulator [Candidatus Bathyarchaeota archaeon]
MDFHRKRRRIGVPKGMLRYMSLQMLKERPMSGSELMDQIYEYTDWRPSPGSIYPMLGHIQEEGYIEPYEDQDPSLKRFKLTDKGLKEINEQLEHGQHIRNRNKCFRKMYWRLHREMPEPLYESFSGLLDAFDEAYSKTKVNEIGTEKLQKILDDTTGEIKKIGIN